MVSLPGSAPTVLRGRVGLSLLVRHGYVLRSASDTPGDWWLETTQYVYLVSEVGGPGYVAYHWHPLGRSSTTTPHLHVPTTIGALDLADAHLPTGPVSLPAVLRLAITELGVRPMRADWREVLDAAERALAD